MCSRQVFDGSLSQGTDLWQFVADALDCKSRAWNFVSFWLAGALDCKSRAQTFDGLWLAGALDCKSSGPDSWMGQGGGPFFSASESTLVQTHQCLSRFRSLMCDGMIAIEAE